MIIDNIEYTHRHSNFMDAKNHALKLVGLLRNSLKVTDGNIDIDIGSILSNIGSPEMHDIERYILKYVTVSEEHGDMAKDIKLSNEIEINAHFNKYRSHYFKLIIDGVKFHFADFLPAGVVSAESMSLANLIK